VIKNNKNTLLSDTLERQSDTRKTKAGWSETSADWDVPTDGAQGPTESAQPAALIASNLHVNHGSAKILKDLSFTLNGGDTLGLLGLNGAGKSTLLKTLAGSLAPTQGTVLIGENELYENQIASRMDIGYAPDKPAVYPEFRVREYLFYIARMRRIAKSQRATAVATAIEKCALGDVRNRIIGNLSSGYQQRVNLAQALLHEPRVLILDEPANGLDPVQLMEMRELITTLAPYQATIFSSHLLAEVDAICNRVILIHHGEQILDSELNQLTHSDNNAYELVIKADTTLHLSELPGVTEACCLSADNWIITGKSLTAAQLQTMLATRGIDITSMQSTDSYLESLFKQLASNNLPGGHVQ